MTWLLLMIVFAVMITAVLWGEFEHWRSSRRWMGSRPGGSGNGEAVLVLGVPEPGNARQHHQLITEVGSHSTRENVHNAVPLIEHADRIKIVSNSLHAERARFYLWQHWPDLAERLVPAADYRFGELTALKPVMAAIGRRHLRSAVRAAAAAAGTAAVASSAQTTLS